MVLLGWFLVSNTLDNLARQNIATGFGFLEREASFGISESLISYSPADTYLRALTVGLLNTIQVSVAGIILTTILGVMIGLARLSTNWLIAKLASVYVETIRNVPVLLQLFFWYAVITQAFPSPRQALEPLPGVFLSNRGIKIPLPVVEAAHIWLLAAFILGIVGTIILFRWARARQELTGQTFPTGWVGAGLLFGLPLLAFIAQGAPLEISTPELRGFNFQGGGSLSPELAALLLGLTVYTASFVAETVRSGILAVPRGQIEAAKAVGLRPGAVLRLVVLPQAMRVIIPPTTNQYLNLAKNSSLAVAIGYPDLVSVANTSINQTGQAIEGIAFIMAVYLILSLLISWFMNWYNKRMSLQGAAR